MKMPHTHKTGFSLNSVLVHCESLLTQSQPQPVKTAAKDAAASTTSQCLCQQEFRLDSELMERKAATDHIPLGTTDAIG